LVDDYICENPFKAKSHDPIINGPWLLGKKNFKKEKEFRSKKRKIHPTSPENQ
jgi:hypothetical protein